MTNHRTTKRGDNMTLPGLIAIIMLGVFILASPAIVAELVGNEGVFQIVENFLKA